MIAFNPPTVPNGHKVSPVIIKKSLMDKAEVGASQADENGDQTNVLGDGQKHQRKEKKGQGVGKRDLPRCDLHIHHNMRYDQVIEEHTAFEFLRPLRKKAIVRLYYDCI